MNRLGSTTWPEVVTLAPRPWLVVPVGSTEQHGPHLPLDADTRIAVAIAEGLAEVRDDVVVAPAVAYGASGEHADFPGTLSIGHEAVELLLVELVRSADYFSGVAFVNGHGGNAAAVGRAADRGTAEGRKAIGWSWSIPGADAHAGRTETSLLLAIAPELVRLDRAAPGVVDPIGELLARLRSEGVREVSPSGVLGDPRGASAEEGARLLAGLVADLGAALVAAGPGT